MNGNSAAQAAKAGVSAPSFDLTPIKAHLAKRHSEITPELLELGEQEYRNFLQKCKQNPGANIVPGHLADKFWHSHLLHSRLYFEHCEAYFGYYLHHTPKPAGVSDQYEVGECFCEGDGGGLKPSEPFAPTTSCG